jgi:hypothetical protein
MDTPDERKRKEEQVETEKDKRTPEVPSATPSPTSRRLLPGAFPQFRTLIVFNWDDTLCPTSWIRKFLQDHTADKFDWSAQELDYRHHIPPWSEHPLPDVPEVRDAVQDLQEAIIKALSVAQTLGVVVIVTDAADGWVTKAVQRWMPKLKQYIAGHGARPPIEVLYGQELYVRPKPGSALAQLGWVDGLGELTWLKKAAMLKALVRLNDIYRLETGGGNWVPIDREGGRDLASVVSIGDSDAEMQAAELAVLAYKCQDPREAAPAGRRPRALSAPAAQGRSTSFERPWVKKLRTKEAPRRPARTETARHDYRPP